MKKVSGFGSLAAFGRVRPEDYRNHLKMVSSANKGVKYPQFHAVISARDASYSGNDLTAIAEKWLGGMGYGEQPYLVIYHHDTDNPHVHIVSTRVSKQGKKIRDSFENIRAIQELNKVLGIDEKHTASADLEKALNYQFGTRAQFRLILEVAGYTLKEVEDKIELIKFGKKLDEVTWAAVDEKLNSYDSVPDRKNQLKALFHKYAALYATEIISERGAYTSKFAVALRDKFGIDLVFHASGDKPPYGYSVIDHAGKTVFKGSEIMPLKQMLNAKVEPQIREEGWQTAERVNQQRVDYYAAMLKAILHNYPDVIQGLSHQGWMILRSPNGFSLYDPSSNTAVNTNDLLSSEEQRQLRDAMEQYTESLAIPGISVLNLTDDADDEAIHGRNRRRKHKARTNTR
ncbi:MAG: relaxase/mobilization nuclease domain-containing protein [Bacteroidetes bacterium]|nr:relaxase/mobilization nuclease domain-containing protein [Bacteroidota bacterium]